MHTYKLNEFLGFLNEELLLFREHNAVVINNEDEKIAFVIKNYAETSYHGDNPTHSFTHFISETNTCIGFSMLKQITIY